MDKLVISGITAKLMALTPAKFDYIRPGSVEEAIQILLDNEGNSKLLGGGQSLIPLLKTRILSFDKLIDIGNLAELNHMHSLNGELSIGSATRVGQLELSEEIQSGFPMLHEAALQIADPLIRNMGTVGGNVSHADPGNDLPPVMVAFDASFTLQGKNGSRDIRAEDFFLGPYENSAEENEVMTGIHIPGAAEQEGSAFVKIRKMNGDFSVASSAARIRLSDDLKIADARIVVASATPMPVRLTELEQSLRGSRIDETTLKVIRKEATENIEIMDDPTVPGKYRRFAISSSVAKAAENAYTRAVGR